MDYPIIITGAEHPDLTQPSIKIRINGEPFATKKRLYYDGGRGSFRTVSAEWGWDGVQWHPIPLNSKQAIDIARKIDTGQIS